jgi:signal transduction histidine kinase
MQGGIRASLLVLVAGVAIPIAYVGFVGIWAMWDVSRRQLDDSIKHQAEITGAAFDEWVVAQREPLATIAAEYAEQKGANSEFLNRFRFAVATRTHWIGLRIVNQAGETLASQPADAPFLAPDTAAGLVGQLQERQWAIDADWSQGPYNGVLMIAMPLTKSSALVAQVDVNATSESFLRKVRLSDQAVFSVFGPQQRIILYRNASAETYVGKDVSSSPLLAALADKPSTAVELTGPIDEVRRVYGLARAGNTGCTAVVGIPSESLYGPARNQFSRHLIFTFAGLLLAVLGALLIAQRIARPVRQLSEAARRFGAGDTSARASVSTSGELEELRNSFNSMAAEIEKREARLTELDRLKSDFVSGVSHEMRTPLTTIKTLTSVLLREKTSDAERAEYLRTIMLECDRQIDLVLNLLDLSRIEAGTYNISLSPVDVAGVVRSCAKTELHNAEQRHQRLEIELPAEPITVQADRAALRRALCGLIQNAIKYTPDGGRIVVSAKAVEREARISVSDTGRGIREEDAPHIFEKFYRGRPPHEPDGESTDEAPSADDTPGVGLGLYLARTVVEEIGGRISVRTKVGRGTTFTVTLPILDHEGEGEDEGEQ